MTYDDWKQTPPEYIPPDERPEGCECNRRIGDNRWCVVHGLDPDDERDKTLERDWDRDVR